MPKLPIVKILESGYTFIRFNSECLVQIPPGFSADEIPDEYIFDPERNREWVNSWWRGQKDKEVTATQEERSYEKIR